MSKNTLHIPTSWKVPDYPLNSKVRVQEGSSSFPAKVIGFSWESEELFYLVDPVDDSCPLYLPGDSTIIRPNKIIGFN